MQYGYTPLHLAARNGRLEVVQLLLRHRADKKLKNTHGEKPADRVCLFGDNKQHKAAITALLR